MKYAPPLFRLIWFVCFASFWPLGWIEAAPYTVKPVPLKLTRSFSGRMAPSSSPDILSPAPATVVSVKHVPGDHVTKGELLVQLSAPALYRSLLEAQSQLLRAQEEWQKLAHWQETHEYFQSQQNARRARFREKRAEAQWIQAQKLFEQGIISKDEFWSANNQRNEAHLHRIDTEKREKMLRERASPEHIHLAEQIYKNAKQVLMRLQRQETALSIRAPRTGVLLSPLHPKNTPLNWSEAKGSRVEEGTPLFRVGSFNSLNMIFLVDEKTVIRLHPRMLIEASIPAFPGEILHGEIRRITAESVSANSERPPEFQVTAVIPKLPTALQPKIRAGMTVKVQVLWEEKPDALLIPLTAVGPEGWVIRQNQKKGSQKGAAFQKQPVRLGATTLNQVEVLEGLQSGDVIQNPWGVG